MAASADCFTMTKYRQQYGLHGILPAIWPVALPAFIAHRNGLFLRGTMLAKQIPDDGRAVSGDETVTDIDFPRR
jgi:hypothetical protein